MSDSSTAPASTSASPIRRVDSSDSAAAVSTSSRVAAPSSTRMSPRRVEVSTSARTSSSNCSGPTRVSRTRRCRAPTWWTGTTRRPPSLSCSSRILGTSKLLAETTIASNGASSGAPRVPSPTRTCTFSMLWARNRSAASSARGAALSRERIDVARWDITAHAYPVPVPMWSTRSVGSSRAASMSAAVMGIARSVRPPGRAIGRSW